MEIQQDFLHLVDEKKESRWEMLTARVTPDEKTKINRHCKEVFKLPYSVVTRLMWRRIMSSYGQMPQGHHNDIIGDINNAAGDIVSYLPVIHRQRARRAGDF